MSGRSTATNLATLMSTPSQVVCNKGQLDVIRFDLSKAFDIVNHTILLAKRSAYGVCGSLLDWIKDHLTKRIAYIRVNNIASSFYRASSEISQGSVLGPLGFSAFVNSASPLFSKPLFLQYSDDIKLYKQIIRSDDCIELQEDACSF